MTTKILLAASIVMLPLTSYALTLKDSVQVVLDTNPLVQEKVKYFRSVKQDVNIAESRYYPTLDVIAGVGRERTKNTSTLFNDRYLNRTEAAIVLNQNIYEGFATKNNINKQLSLVNSAAYSVLEQANKVSLSMVEAYINLFKEKALYDLAEKNLEDQKNINNKIKDRINSGVGAASELEQSSSRLALAESNLLSAQSNYDDKVTAFIKIFGSYIDPADLAEPKAVDGLPSSKVIAFADAKVKNPSLKVQIANMKVAKYNYYLSDKGFRPQVDLEVRQDWNRNVGGVIGTDQSAAVMLKFRWNLYNGGADKASQQKSISELRQEIQSYEDLNRRVDESISLSWTAYTILEKQMQYIKTHRELSAKTLKSYKEEFDLGRRTLLDILDTQSELYSADRELSNAKYDSIYAQYRILESIGTISSYVDENFASIVGLGNNKNSKADTLDKLPKEK